MKISVPPNYRPVVHVRARADRPGKIEAFYALPPQNDEDRIRVRVTLAFNTMRDARLWAADKQARLLRGEFDRLDYERMGVPPPSLERGVTMREFLPRFRELRQRGRKRPLSERYIESMERTVSNYLLPRFADVPLAEIGVDQIDDFVARLLVEDHPRAYANKGEQQHRLAPHSINNILGVLGRILTVAYRRGVIPSRPLIEKLPIDYRDDEDDALSRVEITKLFAACDGVHGRLIKTGILTGCRAMELAALRWEDYEPKWGLEDGHMVGRLHIRRQIQPYLKVKGKRKADEAQRLIRPKWNSVRWVPVGEELAAILNEQAALTRLQDGFIFLTDRGRPFCNELIRKALRRACRRAGLRAVTPQVLRRTFVSQLVMAGADPKSVMKLAGHRSLTVTMRFYARAEAQHLLGAGNRLEKHLFPGTVKSGSEAHRSSGDT